MLLLDNFSPRPRLWSALLLILSTGPCALAAGETIQACGCSRDLAFARYVTSQGQRDTFSKSGPLGVLIEASLPDLYKSAALFAIRTDEGGGEGDLRVLRIEGDGTVAEEVIDRYFAVRRQLDALPPLSTAITPANYKFHFASEVKTRGASAYIYDIAPKKNRPGLLSGQVWMDSEAGQEVLLAGHLSGVPGIAGRVDIVRDTTAGEGPVGMRVTHVSFTVPQLGRAEVVVTEVVLNQEFVTQAQ